MNFHLGVWRSEIALSDNDAAKQYAALSEGQETPHGFDDAVYAFCHELTALYPDIEMIPEGEEESSPWACSLEVSGVHVIMAILADQSANVLPVILQIADRHGLVCFDPQNVKVHLPSQLVG